MDTRIGWGGKGQDVTLYKDHHDIDYDPDDDDDGNNDDDGDHLVSAEGKLDGEESLPRPVSLALLNL